MDYIFRFQPYLKPVIWGGDRIAALKGVKTDRSDIGESWEISGVPSHQSVVADGDDAGMTLTELIRKYGARLVGDGVLRRFGEEFPLLIKFIDARRDLSVQVHPDDALARARHNSAGKTEMWYILDTTDDARIYAGLSSELTPDKYTRLVADKSIMDVVAAHPSHKGDVFFLPAGRIHAIGAGNLLAEIQQTSDITYRVYDYDRRDADGNPRELHTELAKDAIDYTVYPDYVTEYDRQAADCELASCEYFTVRRYLVNGESRIAHSSQSFTIVICTEGECEIICGEQTVPMSQLQTVLVAAEAPEIICRGRANVITATV